MSDPQGQRRPLGFFKIPDIDNPDEETINAVADAIYQQMIEQARAGMVDVDPDDQEGEPSATASEDNQPGL